jgi:hypothetical protein
MSGVPKGAVGVTGNTWRDYFYIHKPLILDNNNDADKEKRRKEAGRKDFDRCRSSLQNADIIQCVGEWYWFQS